MPLQLGINIGFVTNSSSMVYHVPKAVLEDPNIKAFLQAFELEEGFVGSDLWSRDTCETFAVTKEQKLEARKKLDEYWDDPEFSIRTPAIDVEDDSTVVLIFGDEYPGVVSSLLGLLREVLEKDGGRGLFGDEYN